MSPFPPLTQPPRHPHSLLLIHSCSLSTETTRPDSNIYKKPPIYRQRGEGSPDRPEPPFRHVPGGCPEGGGVMGKQMFITACKLPCALPCALVLHPGAHRCEEGERREWGAKVGGGLRGGGCARADLDLPPQSPQEAALRASTSLKTSSSSRPSSLQRSLPTPTSQPRSKQTTGRAPRRWPLWVGERGPAEAPGTPHPPPA